MLKAVYEINPSEAARFLRNAGREPPDDLDRFAFLRIVDDGRCVGYVWYGWLTAEEIMMHIHLLADARNRWNRSLIRALHWFPTILGARRLVALEPNDKAAALARSAGWQSDDKGGWSIGLPCAWSC